jgi:hypothetical protein
MRDRFLAFVIEQNPFAVNAAADAFDRVVGKRALTSEKEIEALRAPLAEALKKGNDLGSRFFDIGTKNETRGHFLSSPGVTTSDRVAQGVDALVDACDGFLRREAIAASLTNDERL